MKRWLHQITKFWRLVSCYVMKITRYNQYSSAKSNFSKYGHKIISIVGSKTKLKNNNLRLSRSRVVINQLIQKHLQHFIMITLMKITRKIQIFRMKMDLHHINLSMMTFHWIKILVMMPCHHFAARKMWHRISRRIKV